MKKFGIGIGGNKGVGDSGRQGSREDNPMHSSNGLGGPGGDQDHITQYIGSSQPPVMSLVQTSYNGRSAQLQGFDEQDDYG